MAVRGIDEQNVSKWFTENVPEVELPLDFTLIAGGRSNLTFRVEDVVGHRWALRRPPLSHVLPTAHDMAREHRIISAVGPAGVPVPTTVGLCTDAGVSGAAFYVMEFVDGHILRTAEQAMAAFDEPTRADIGNHLADALASLHAIDPDDVGLGDLARRDGYIERQLRRWSGQFQRAVLDGDSSGGVVERVASDLGKRIPEQVGLGIVHGDYRIDNTVLDDRGDVRAVLDWELCTLGDPMADVGLLMVYWNGSSEADAGIGVSASTAPGMATRQEVLARYAKTSRRDVSALPFYMAFGYWKLACVLQGVYARYLGGAGAGDSASVDRYPATVRRLASTAAEVLAAW